MSNTGSSTMGEQQTIMAKLKQDTKDYHAKLESLPYFNALMEHKLPMECYVNQLRALSIIHGVMENEIAAVEDSRVANVWNDDLRKLVLLEEDLSFFKPRVILDADAPIEAALSMTVDIRIRRVDTPVTLLGYLYVFEGSTLGNSMHRPDISKTFHLDELNGCRYYASYQDNVQTHWSEFSKNMNNALSDDAVHDSVIEAAHDAFDGLEVLYKALYPLNGAKRKYHLIQINPEAGNHPMPEDEREIQAALEASDRGWAEFGYYAQRYGERGKRFSDSDTCWLVTLASLEKESLQQQIDWLCRVLATRGMPTIMMEKTLRFLYQALVEAIPDKAYTYEKLLISADRLKNARERHIDDASFVSLAEEFERSMGKKWIEKHHNTGELLVSAVADEQNGITGAIDALQDWLTDADRFPPEWIRAVKKTIGKARNQITK